LPSGISGSAGARHTRRLPLAAYADFLLEQKRPQEVGTLLRKVGAIRQPAAAHSAGGESQNLPEAQKHAQALGERFAAAGLRGERCISPKKRAICST
jgi:hypothetical protein